ncbi:MAG: N-6 DNA methylase [Anaerolineales bacterium]|nr:N-6 DNA methylase [Anaerolineales bacterium]
MNKQFSSNKQPIERQKLRGGYYTPLELAQYVTNWAIRDGMEKILEPSCGDGNFLVSLLQRVAWLEELGHKVSPKVTAIEIEPLELEKAKKRAFEFSPSVEIEFIAADFFEVYARLQNENKFDVIIGNPPFIRFQHFNEDSRQKAFGQLKSAGYNPTKLANVWSAFVQLSIELLDEGGRLAMVLPAELLQVGYATELRNRLASQFSHIVIIGFRKLIFPEIQQEVVLLLAEGKRQVSLLESDIHTIEFEDGNSLVKSANLDDAVAHIPGKHSHPGMKWTALFLSEASFSALDEAQQSKQVISLGKLAQVDVGVVTGRNNFFLVTDQQRQELFAENFSLPVVGKTSALKSITFDETDFEQYQSSERAYLLNLTNIQPDDFPQKLNEYILQGETEKVHEGYKCRNRKRWFDVPSIYAPHAFMYRQIHRYPLLVVNRAGATSTDTIHRVRFINGTYPEKLAAICFNSLTLASAEVGGRSYGGGVLELEPREAEQLPIPYNGKINIDYEKVDQLLRKGDDDSALEYVDEIVLKGYMGLNNLTIKNIRNAWIELRERRINRRFPKVTYEQAQIQQLRLLEKKKTL